MLSGAAAVADHTTTYSALYPHLVPAFVNGTAAVVVAPGGRVFSVMSFAITRRRITRIDALVDPERLAAWSSTCRGTSGPRRRWCRYRHAPCLRRDHPRGGADERLRRRLELRGRGVRRARRGSGSRVTHVDGPVRHPPRRRSDRPARRSRRTRTRHRRATGLVLYFVCAISAHVRARDHGLAGPAFFLVLAACALAANLGYHGLS